jgi:hypothetical protein
MKLKDNTMEIITYIILLLILDLLCFVIQTKLEIVREKDPFVLHFIDNITFCPSGHCKRKISHPSVCG